MIVFLKIFFWWTVVSALLILLCLRLSRAMYASEGTRVPWRYFRLLALPFVGILGFFVVLVGDWRAHLLNEESKNRHRPSKDEDEVSKN